MLNLLAMIKTVENHHWFVWMGLNCKGEVQQVYVLDHRFLENLFLLEQSLGIAPTWSCIFRSDPGEDISWSKDEWGLLKGCWQSSASVNITSSHLQSKLLIFQRKQLREWDSATTVLPWWTKNSKSHLFSIQTALINLAEATKIAISCRDDRITFLPSCQDKNLLERQKFSFPPLPAATSKSLKIQRQITHKCSMWLSASRIPVNSRCCWWIKDL